MDDGNIREGLGSLNRWSQSTTSSSLSPNLVSHRRQESAPRLLATDNHASHKKMLSLESNPQARLFSQIGDETGKDGGLARHHTSQSSTGWGHKEISLSDRPEITILSKTSTNLTGPSSLQQEPSPFQSAPLHREARTQMRLPDKGPFEQVPGDYVTQTSIRSHSQNDRRRQGPSQKAMLSKALQKANTAVLLDNAANFEGAMEAYNDACQLLQLVMLRSNGGEDERIKLQEIRDTYMIRVTELQRMDVSFRNVDSKALPERPLSQESYGEYIPNLQEDDYSSIANEEPGFLGQEMLGTREAASGGPRTFIKPHIPPRRQSLLPSALDDGFRSSPFSSVVKGQTDISRPVAQGQLLAHRRVDSETAPEFLEDPILEEGKHSLTSRLSELSILSAQVPDPNESTSWLDTIDESGGSSSTSLRSKASSVYLRRRRSTGLSHGTEAEFDAALDAAVEAAYDEGFEPASGSEAQEEDEENDDVLANARRNVELAKQKVREAEREAEVAMTRGSELRRAQEQGTMDDVNDTGLDYLDEDAEEEERLLEEMTRGYVMDDFEFDHQSKSALPRQSTLSGPSRNIWENPAILNSVATGGILPPLVEDDTLPSEPASIQQAEPSIPPEPSRRASRSTPAQGVRARRMSGQNKVELKIETNTHSRSGSGLTNSDFSRPLNARKVSMSSEKDSSLANGSVGIATSVPHNVHQAKRNVSIGSVNEDISPKLKLAREITAVEDDDTAGAPKMLSPSRPPIGKVPSAPDYLGRPHPGTLSFRARNVSVPNPDVYTDSPATPSMNAFPTLDLQKEIATTSINALPTPSAMNFASSGLPSDGLYLFDDYIHSPTSPGSPNPLAANSPLPLEPCPESFLLRPFWLMRCIYQTIAHPRGGYLSTKLFIPRDVWRVKNVKIKAVEEKVSNCDLLTAALLRLSKVDTYDADAVLEEMQALESVLDQVQISLSKKVGNEVGVQGAMPLFKSAQTLDDAAAVDALPSRTSNGSSKSYLTSWRKLRSKNSGFSATTLSSSKEASKDHLTLSSLPMTPIPNAQHASRNITQLQFNGPNANYMSALARLCDAAQVLDQIAQQVEDPGLKHSSQTLVGLELSTRHAAEFFGFYICRFALNDMGIMLDKFIKRGSEWVLL
ncbi:uncharacterized protein DSM5745_02672 [Aspergillus mulundensis]|uniref:MIT domain-containing protein n=1 Tax=Aspergillus mulundensis TaxID=1810919 RepID=A0A3D8SX41_9EURO|nr:Uncharacterized protein DSM5745_02672 [Aspergillus mulundensis]RDW90897.1 Uncharacterized protein DSM5745_02672 [Aspergillus mulundensis]